MRFHWSHNSSKKRLWAGLNTSWRLCNGFIGIKLIIDIDDLFIWLWKRHQNHAFLLSLWNINIKSECIFQSANFTNNNNKYCWPMCKETKLCRQTTKTQKHTNTVPWCPNRQSALRSWRLTGSRPFLPLKPGRQTHC